MENNEKKICGLIGLAMRAGKVSFGMESCQESIMKNKVKLVVIAKDAASRTKLNFNNLCKNKNIKMIEFGTIELLSKTIGKNNKAVIAIKNRDFSNAILNIINGGEIIG